MNKKKFIAIILCLTMIISMMVGCGKSVDSKNEEKTTTADNAEKTITITDSSGSQVEIPAKINRIADAWGAHNEILATIGAADKIVATTLTPEVRPWLYKANPNLKNAVTTFSIDASEVNVEELIKTKPDIVFMSLNDKLAKQIIDLGIPVVQVNFTDLESLKECVRLTGTIVGGDAKENAEKYISYLDEKMKMISNVTSKIPTEQKPKILHLASFSPLTVDGKDAIITSGIELAGGINVANITGKSKATSLEQVFQWNPDMILMGRVLTGNGIKNSAAVSETDSSKITNDPIWNNLNAVKNGKVVINPDGAFSWDRYSAEEALQIQWMAKLINPDKFTNIDMVKETKYFFKTFMNYDLSEEEANLMLAGEPPKN
ncbi:ABC transporter substrate-binding protein [Clostridium sp.]|uniref:ABC transporter substrate-binding protein n=1 Tax=Clostridium sp. TaxID=1506 RepID=UPI00262972EC|nr:ABC transporter substrate-binding protein [Clostridium sp.]